MRAKRLTAVSYLPTVRAVFRRPGPRGGLAYRRRPRRRKSPNAGPNPRRRPRGRPGSLGRLGGVDFVQLGRDRLVILLRAEVQRAVDRSAAPPPDPPDRLNIHVPAAQARAERRHFGAPCLRQSLEADASHDPMTSIKSFRGRPEATRRTKPGSAPPNISKKVFRVNFSFKLGASPRVR